MRGFAENDRPALPDALAGDALAENGYDGMAAAIRNCFRIFYRRLWIIGLIIVAGMLSSIWYNSWAPRIFEAAATLQIGADPNVLGLDRPLVDQRDWTREFLPTQLAVLESRELASIARQELKLSAASNDGDDKRLPTADEIAEGRTISPLNNTRLVSIGFRSEDPVLAAHVANALGRAYVKWNTLSKSSTTGEASDWLKRQVEEQRKLVQASEAALQQYKKEHGAEALGERQNIVVQKLGDLQGAVTRARSDVIEKQTIYQQLSALQSRQDGLDTLPAIASNTFVHNAKDELASLQRQLAQASEQLGQRHPDIIKLHGAVENAERRLRSEISTLGAAIRNDYEAAQAREHALSAAFERQKIEVQELNAKAVEYTALDRAATANRLLLDNLEQRSKQITLARDTPSASAGLLDAAEVPDTPILPRKKRNIILALTGSGALSLALVFLLEIFNTRMTSPDDVKRLRVQVLGVAPQLKLENGKPRALFGLGARPRVHGGEPVELATWNQKGSLLAESFRATLTSILLSGQNGHDRQVILVTSPSPREGKTTVVTNLALALAEIRSRVLLIDADLRNPRIHGIFAQGNTWGLSDLLQEETPCADYPVEALVRKTHVPGLFFLPSGTSAENVSLLYSARMAELLKRLRNDFDAVLIDTPPLLAVADARVLSRLVDAVVLVFRAGETNRQAAMMAVDMCQADGVRVLGTVFNDWTPRTIASGYYRSSATPAPITAHQGRLL